MVDVLRENSRSAFIMDVTLSLLFEDSSVAATLAHRVLDALNVPLWKTATAPAGGMRSS